MKRDFGGQAAAYYHRYRHGYPSAVVDALADAFKLTGQDMTVDLGCGTGQLSLPIARQVRAVIGMDVEPDMLQHAQQAARDANARNVMWMLGADTDISALRRLLGDRTVAAVTIAQALHWMNHQDLFRPPSRCCARAAVLRSSPTGRRCGCKKPAGPGRCVISLSTGWAPR